MTWIRREAKLAAQGNMSGIAESRAIEDEADRQPVRHPRPDLPHRITVASALSPARATPSLHRGVE